MVELIRMHLSSDVGTYKLIYNEIEDILKEAREYYRKKGLISDEEWSDYMKALSTSR